MTAKILKQNRQFVCRSTLRHLSIEKLDSPVHAATRTHFDNMIVERIGPNSTPGDFDAEDLTPEMHHFIGHTIEEGSWKEMLTTKDPLMRTTWSPYLHPR